MSKPFRLAVVNSHPIQYFAPLYAYLDKDPALEVTALYCTDFSIRGSVDPGFGQVVRWDIDLLAGYRHVFLGARAKVRTPGGFWSLVCPQAWTEIRNGNYDAVLVHGYGYFVNLLAFAAAKSKGIPVLMRSETHLGLQGNPLKRWLRDTALGFAYRFVDGFLAIGSANRRYYRALGVPDEKISSVPYTVDNARFKAASRLMPEARALVRARLGLPASGPVVLYASKFMPRKHPDDVVRAIALLKDKSVDTTLYLVGTGEMDAELRSLVEALRLDNVVFGGFKNQGELPEVYAACDLFVLPSEHEPWGLIVNEVMSTGLPVVVSEEVGCVPDLVADGVNGYCFPAGDVEALAGAIERIIGDEETLRRMGRESMATMETWSYEQCRQGVLETVARLEKSSSGMAETTR